MRARLLSVIAVLLTLAAVAPASALELKPAERRRKVAVERSDERAAVDEDRKFLTEDDVAKAARDFGDFYKVLRASESIVYYAAGPHDIEHGFRRTGHGEELQFAGFRQEVGRHLFVSGAVAYRVAHQIFTPVDKTVEWGLRFPLGAERETKSPALEGTVAMERSYKPEYPHLTFAQRITRFPYPSAGSTRGFRGVMKTQEFEAEYDEGRFWITVIRNTMGGTGTLVESGVRHPVCRYAFASASITTNHHYFRRTAGATHYDLVLQAEYPLQRAEDDVVVAYINYQGAIDRDEFDDILYGVAGVRFGF